MESSQSNTLRASIGSMTGQSQPQTQSQTVPQQQTETQVPTLTKVEFQTGSEVNVGGKRKKGGSVVWDHCKKIKKKDDKGVEQVLGVCNYCKKEIPAHSKKNGSTGLKNHLEKACKSSPLYQSSDTLQPVLINETMGAALVPHTFNQKRHELMCVKYIIRDELPFRAVEGELPFRAVEGVGFRDFITDLQPRFKIPNRKKIAAGVLDLFLVERAKIMSVIGDQRVSVTANTWTLIQNINYLVVTVHFLDSDWKLHKRIISFSKITSHKGDDIGRCLEVCLNSWGIDKVFSITFDNSSANDVAVEYMAKRFKALNTLMLDGKYLHMRCACHILNLIVKDGLKELYSSIEGIRNCVKYIHSSSARLDKFREFFILERRDKMAIVTMDTVEFDL